MLGILDRMLVFSLALDAQKCAPACPAVTPVLEQHPEAGKTPPPPDAQTSSQRARGPAGTRDETRRDWTPRRYILVL